MLDRGNCSMPDCIMRVSDSTNTTDEMDLASHSLGQFGFNDIFNVVAYSAMSIGKRKE